jgi:TolB protein
MKGYRKSNLLWLMIVGFFLSGCGQAVSQNKGLVTPSLEPSQIVPTSTETPSPTIQSNECKKIAFVVSSGGNSDIYSACPDGSNLAQLTDSPSTETTPAWSPDGKTIAFASSRSGSSQIYIMGEDGSNPIMLTSDYENDFPVWLPNGRQIAFRTTDAKGLWWWRIVNIEGTQVAQFTKPSYDFFFQTPAWSPDGNKIVYMSLLEQKQRNDGSSQIHIKNVDGSNDVALTNDIWANVNPVWSPNGAKIAFLSERDGTYNKFALFVMSADGKAIQKLSDPIYSENVTFTWSPDSQEIAISTDVIIDNIYIINVSTGDKRVLVNLSDGKRASFP